MKKIVYVEGMTCDHCVKRVTKALEGVGLSKVRVDLSGRAEANGVVEDSAVHAAVEDAGYKVTHIQSLKE